METVVIDSKRGNIGEQLKKMNLEKLGKFYDKDYREKQMTDFEKHKNCEVDYRHEWIMSKIDKKQKILDVGSGAGLFVYHLDKKGYEVTGCDISKEVLKALRTNMPDIKFYQCAVEELTFPNNKFDVVVASQVIEHLKEPVIGIKEMCRVAKDKVILTTPIEKNLLDSTHLHFFNFYDLVKVVKEGCGHDNFTISRLNKFLDGEKKNCFGVIIYLGEKEDE